MPSIEQDAPILSRPATREGHSLLAFAMVCVFVSGSLFAGFLSQGVYHEDDLTHYLFARWSQHDARYLVDSWGRPGFTIPYSWAATIGTTAQGMAACRMFSAVLAGATAWLCFCIARQLGIRHAWAAAPLLFLQPLFARLSFTTLTETPLALYLALGTWLLLTGRTGCSAFVIALAPVTRDEAVILLPLWAVALCLQKGRWWNYPLLLWAVVAHNLVSGLWLDAWPVARWFKPAGADHYGQGTPLTFIPKLAYACGLVTLALSVSGARSVIRRRSGWIVVVAPLAWLTTQTLIYLRGAYASGGYARFLVPICPWIAVLAAAGLRPLTLRRIATRSWASLGLTLAAIWILCEAEMFRREPVIAPGWETWARVARIGAAGLTVLTSICAGILLGRRKSAGTLPLRIIQGVAAALLAVCLGGYAPFRLSADQAGMRDVASLLVARPLAGQPVLTLNRWIYYWSGQWIPWPSTNQIRNSLAGARPGTMFAWDRRFCTEPDVHLAYSEMCNTPGWQLVWQKEPAVPGDDPSVACFERLPVMEAAKSPPTASQGQ
jgi:hypothetical protein